MAEKKRTEEPDPVSGELVPGGARNVPASPIQRLVSRFAIWNRFYKKSIESERELFDEGTKLGEAIIKHRQMCDRLDDVQTLIDGDRDERLRVRMEARNRLNDALLKHEAWEKDKKIYETSKDIEVEQAKQRKLYELKKQELLYKKEIAELEKALAAFKEPEPVEKKTRGSAAARKQAEITKEVRRYEKEKERIEKSGDSDAAKTKLLKSADITHQQAFNAINEKYK